MVNTPSSKGIVDTVSHLEATMKSFGARAHWLEGRSIVTWPSQSSSVYAPKSSGSLEIANKDMRHTDIRGDCIVSSTECGSDSSVNSRVLIDVWSHEKEFANLRYIHCVGGPQGPWEIDGR